MLLRLLLPLLLVSASLTGCSSSLRTNHTLVNRLKNRGPIGLSTDNPYLAANMFLSEEARTSEIIGGFIDHRGPPPALEVEGDIFNDITLKFFYPVEREYFIAEEVSGSWIINGPHRVPEELMSQLISITGGGEQPPLLVAGQNGSSKRMPSDGSATPFARLPTDLEATDPKKDPFISSSRKPGSPTTQNPRASSTNIRQTTSRTLAIERVRQENKNKPAEVTPKGDLVHYVNYATENLEMISEWYTDDPGNAERLARINRVKGKLRVGDMIIIPSYLVTFNGRLTQQALAALQRQ